MAEDDKTYCGQGERIPLNEDNEMTIAALVTKLGISRQDVLDAMEQVGTSRAKLVEFFRSKENSY
jgi:hypothetical protein